MVYKIGEINEAVSRRRRLRSRY